MRAEVRVELVRYFLSGMAEEPPDDIQRDLMLPQVCGEAVSQIPQRHRPGPVFFLGLFHCIIPPSFPDVSGIGMAGNMENEEGIRLYGTHTVPAARRSLRFISRVPL